MRTFRQIIDAWPTRSDLAADLGVDYGVVKQWWRRNSVPSGYWLALLRSAALRGLEFTQDDLAVAAEQRAAQPDKPAGAEAAA